MWKVTRCLNQSEPKQGSHFDTKIKRFNANRLAWLRIFVIFLGCNADSEAELNEGAKQIPAMAEIFNQATALQLRRRCRH